MARCAGLVGLVGLVGCSGTAPATNLYTPITGVLVRSDALVSGIGCGTRDDQVYKYAAVVTQGTQTLQISGIGVGMLADCFADAKFANLLAGPDGTLSFSVQIYGYSQKAYVAAQAKGLTSATAMDFAQLQAFAPTYATSCRATQQQDVEVLAVCDPLRLAASASIRVETAQFATGAGNGPLLCQDAAGKPKDFTRVQAFATSDGNVTGVHVNGDCPAALDISPVVAPATYALSLDLLDPTGARVVGTVRCHADTRPGLETVATCEPATL